MPVADHDTRFDYTLKPVECLWRMVLQQRVMVKMYLLNMYIDHVIVNPVLSATKVVEYQ